MNRTIIHSRDELICIDVDSVAYLKAAGNYTELFYMNNQGKALQLTISISKLYEELKTFNGRSNFFFKLGRSYVINDVFLRRIKLNGIPMLYLGDSLGHTLRVEGLSKSLLRAYKEAVVLKEENQNKKSNRKKNSND